jgi:hypothetical protein
VFISIAPIFLLFYTFPLFFNKNYTSHLAYILFYGKVYAVRCNRRTAALQPSNIKNYLGSKMNTLNIEQGLLPAHSIALMELLALYLEYHTKLDKSDKYATKQGFDILIGMFPEEIPTIATFKVGFLIKYQKKLIEMGYAKSQINKLFNVVKRVFAWAGKPRYDLETWDKLPPIIPSDFITDMNAIEPVDEGKENPPRIDVPTENVEAIFPYVSPIIKDMLRIQLLYLTQAIFYSF